MKKLCKFIWKVTKLYAILDILCITFIGAAELLHMYNKYPDKSVMENNILAWDEAREKFKNYWKN